MPRSRSDPSLSVRFGFDNAQRHRALYQLGELLELNRRQYKDMEKRFKKVTKKHLDIDNIGCSQQPAIEMAIKDLRSQLPALFVKENVEKLEYFARRIILFMHTTHRRSRRRRRTPEEDETSDDDARRDAYNHFRGKKTIPRPFRAAKPGLSLAQRMAANLLSIKNGTHAPKIFASPARALPNVQSSTSDGPVVTRLPLSDISASGSHARRQCSPVLPPQTPDTHVNASPPLSSISEPRAANDQVPPPSLACHYSSHIDRSRAINGEETFSTPTTSSSNMIASSPTSTSCGDMQGCSVPVPLPRGGQIRSVHKFLEAAKPSMTHLLHRFIEFGCLSEDFLFAVSMWSPERIRTFLKSLPLGPGGSALTRMEVDVLAYHFETYFLASNLKA